MVKKVLILLAICAPAAAQTLGTGSLPLLGQAPADGKQYLEVGGARELFPVAVTQELSAPPTARRVSTTAAIAGLLPPATLKGTSPMAQNIRAFVNGTPSAFGGAIHQADAQGMLVTTTQFSDALIEEVGFPALDRAVSQPGKIRVQFRPGATKSVKGAGAIAPARMTAAAWLTSRFSVQIGGLPEPVKVEAFSFRRRGTGLVEIPSLVVTIPPNGFQQWADKYETFAMNGQNGTDNEMTGSIVYRDASGQAVLELTFAQIGISEFRRSASATDRTAQVTMYFETMVIR